MLLMGKSTISMAIFNSFSYVYQSVTHLKMGDLCMISHNAFWPSGVILQHKNIPTSIVAPVC